METLAFVYMVRCRGGALYTGWTTDPQARLYAHRTGTGAKFTRAFPAARLAYLEQMPDKGAALRREAALKKLKKPEKEALSAAFLADETPRLSLAAPADAADILALYRWYVENHTATFQITPPTLEEYRVWVEATLRHAPLLLARDGSGRLLGFACAHLWHEREAFAWDVETTIYCAPWARGLGVGDALYPPLLELLRRQGYWNAYALVADPNPASEAFHKKYGFVCEGRSPRTGYKFGKWLGLSTWCLPLRRGRGAPEAVLPPDANEICRFLARWQTEGEADAYAKPNRAVKGDVSK